jgi:hypothetical protein
LVAILL